MITITTYKDKRGEWRWRATRKGRIIATSGEGYKRRATMMKTFNNMLDSFWFEEYEIDGVNIFEWRYRSVVGCDNTSETPPL